MECFRASSDWKRWRLRTMSLENSRGQYWFERIGAMKAGQRRAQRARREGRVFAAGWARESWTAVAKRGQRYSRSAWVKVGISGGGEVEGGG